MKLGEAIAPPPTLHKMREAKLSRRESLPPLFNYSKILLRKTLINSPELL
jgi:hypothetical protein